MAFYRFQWVDLSFDLTAAPFRLYGRRNRQDILLEAITEADQWTELAMFNPIDPLLNDRAVMAFESITKALCKKAQLNNVLQLRPVG